MKRLIICAAFIFGSFVSVSVPKVLAGGCCYKYYNVTQGYAGFTQAVINVAFVDPRELGKATYGAPLSNVSMNIIIDNPQAGQSCTLDNSTTNNDGALTARCSSSIPGTMKVYFQSPALDAAANSNIGWVKKDVYFEGQTTTPTPVPTGRPVLQVQRTVQVVQVTARVEATVTPTPKPTTKPTATPKIELPVDVQEQTEAATTAADDVKKLQEKVNELETKISTQEHKVNILTQIVQRISDIFHRIFRF